jgi:hypothetical protein
MDCNGRNDLYPTLIVLTTILARAKKEIARTSPSLMLDSKKKSDKDETMAKLKELTLVALLLLMLLILLTLIL